MNPEFLTQKNATFDFLHPMRTVIGCAKKSVGERIKRLYKTILKGNQQYFITDTMSAELSKYMSNLMLASKVLLANEFLAIAKKIGAHYPDVRAIVGLLKQTRESALI